MELFAILISIFLCNSVTYGKPFDYLIFERIDNELYVIHEAWPYPVCKYMEINWDNLTGKLVDEKMQGKIIYYCGGWGMCGLDYFDYHGTYATLDNYVLNINSFSFNRVYDRRIAGRHEDFITDLNVTKRSFLIKGKEDINAIKNNEIYLFMKNLDTRKYERVSEYLEGWFLDLLKWRNS